MPRGLNKVGQHVHGFGRLPEGFNAYLELRARDALTSGQILAGFCAIVLLGPLTAWFGFSYLRETSGALGAMMLFAAGGLPTGS